DVGASVVSIDSRQSPSTTKWNLVHSSAGSATAHGRVNSFVLKVSPTSRTSSRTAEIASTVDMSAGAHRARAPEMTTIAQNPAPKGVIAEAAALRPAPSAPGTRGERGGTSLAR